MCSFFHAAETISALNIMPLRRGKGEARPEAQRGSIASLVLILVASRCMFAGLFASNLLNVAMGHNPNRFAPSEHPNPTTEIGSNMGGAPTPKWDPIGFDPQPYSLFCPVGLKGNLSLLDIFAALCQGANKQREDLLAWPPTFPKVWTCAGVSWDPSLRGHGDWFDKGPLGGTAPNELCPVAQRVASFFLGGRVPFKLNQPKERCPLFFRLATGHLKMSTKGSLSKIHRHTHTHVRSCRLC